MGCEYEILKTPYSDANGEAVLVIVTHTPAGTTVVHYEWYLFRRYPQTTLAYFYRDRDKIDTAPIINDIRHPEKQLTVEDGKATLIGEAKNKLYLHLAETYVDDASTIVEPEFVPADLIALRKFLIANAGRKEITLMKDKTRCTKLQEVLLDLLARNPEPKPKTGNPYTDESPM